MPSLNLQKPKIMNKTTKARHQNRFKTKPTCFRCQKQIKIGEVFHSGPTSRKKYCKKCFELIFIEIPDHMEKKY